MTSDLFVPAAVELTARSLSITDLLRTADTLKQSGHLPLVELLYGTWIQHNPNHPMLHAVLFNHAVVLSDLGKVEPARQALERAIVLSPDFMPARVNLGRTYERLGNVGMALVSWSSALAGMAAVNGASIGHKAMALNQSARVLEGANRDDAAETMLQQSLDLDCHQREVIQHLLALRQRQCEWPVLAPSERVSRRVLAEGISPLSLAAFTDDPMLQLASAWNYNRLDVGTPTNSFDAWPRAVESGGPLRVGYLSSDLREHAVGYLMTEVFPLHDPRQVEVFAYYCGTASRDSLHEHFKTTAHHWVDISHKDDAEAAQQIAEDGIQILVDLNGYTRDARLKLVARRPAPVIVNWLGYPGTMASPYHDYIIADDWIIPEDHELYYSEKVLRLPCYQPSNRNRVVAAQTPSRREARLPDDAMVYCCFNGLHKLTKFTFDRWLTILERVPGSVLWLLAGQPSTEERLRCYAAEKGIAKERLVFAEKLANPFHLARYPLANLFLDTTPYGAHTTASDALWMGLPVLTVSGRSFASRVCGSLVRAAGMPDMVATSLTEYVERAIEFGRNPDSLQPLRERLRQAHDSSTLFDMAGLVRRLEELYQQMWRDQQSGALPRPDLRNLDVYLEVGNQMDPEALEVQSIDDYQGWWRGRLAERDRFRPTAPDGRLIGLEKECSNRNAGSASGLLRAIR
jgi:predicted O-linked N-acetylglucosamine transferase (SPINDLY family)